jgi:hypothetical protein
VGRVTWPPSARIRLASEACSGLWICATFLPLGWSPTFDTSTASLSPTLAQKRS